MEKKIEAQVVEKPNKKRSLERIKHETRAVEIVRKIGSNSRIIMKDSFPTHKKDGKCRTNEFQEPKEDKTKTFGESIIVLKRRKHEKFVVIISFHYSCTSFV